MKHIYFYSLFIVCTALVILLSSSSLINRKSICSNHLETAFRKDLTDKDLNRKNPEMTVYHFSEKDPLQYVFTNHEIKELPENNSVKVKVDFTNQVFIVNNFAFEGPFRLNIINNSGRIKAAFKDQHFIEQN